MTTLKWINRPNGLEATGKKGLRYTITQPAWATNSWWTTVYGPLGGSHVRAAYAPLDDAKAAAEAHNQKISA